ncbi:MAG: GNAT family N-acetyltransferase [Syntrophaceae bacterium]
MEYKFLDEAADRDSQRQIIELYREAGWWSRSDDAAPELVGRLIAGSHCFIVCVSGDEIAGMGRALSDRVYDAYIQDVFVKPGFRKRGIAREITRQIIDRLLQDGMKWIGLISTPEAKAMYSKMGFQEIDRTAMLLKTGEEMQC